MPKGHYTRAIREVLTPPGPSTSYVELTQGQWATIDSWRAKEVGAYNWFAKWSKPTRDYYAARNIANGDGQITERLHAFILGEKPGLVIDHKMPGRGTDCREANLRHATAFQQAQNHRRMANNSSGFKGVFQESERCFRASITENGELRIIGWYPSAEKAFEAYQREAIAVFGEFAHLD